MTSILCIMLIIEKNSDNTCALFALLTGWWTLLCQELLNFYFAKSCAEFASLLADTIQKVAQAVRSFISDIGVCVVLLKSIQLAWHSSILSAINRLKSSSCRLDILPAGLFRNVIYRMASDLVQIVNTSLLRLFPTAPENCHSVVKPLLKKE